MRRRLLERARKSTLRRMLTDRCDLLALSETPSPTGAPERTYTLRYSNVPCRFRRSLLNSRNALEDIGESVELADRARIMLAHDAPVEEGMRIRRASDGAVFDIVNIEQGLTDAVATRVFGSRYVHEA